jgi:hypothetical protein
MGHHGNYFLSFGGVVPPEAIGGWIELARTTLGSAGDDITVSSLADKRYYMVLAHTLATGTSQSQVQMGNSSIDTGSNYAGRFSNSGGADVSLANDTDISISDSNSGDTAFEMGYIANLSGKEKLGQFWNILQQNPGAANAPGRTESVGKWVNTSNPLDIINWFNRATGSFNTNSELVVLGWDPADTHTTNFWEVLADVDLSGGEADLLEATFTTKKYLWYQAYFEDSGAVNPELYINGVKTGNPYARRRSNNGSADNVATSQNTISFAQTGAAEPVFENGFIVNDGSNEVLGFQHGIEQGAVGAANTPTRLECFFKSANTTAVTEINFDNIGAGNFGTNSFLKVWGSN